MDINDDLGSGDENQELSISADLEAQLDAMQSAGDSDVEDKPAESAEKPSRNRDETGKFAKEVEPVVNDPVAEPNVDVVPPDVEAKGQKFGLTKEEIKEFAKASPSMQAAFERRFNQSMQGVQQYQQKAEYGTAVERAIASGGSQWQEMLKQNGISHEDAVGRLVRADSMLRLGSPEQKAQFFSQLASEYGIPLQNLQQMTPEQANMMRIQQYIEQQQRQQQQYQQTEQQRQNDAITAQIDAFKADPAHEHFPLVQDHMAALLQGGNAADLKSAYEQAVWANPQTRAIELQKQQAAAQAANKSTAQAARSAASVNTTKRPAATTSKPVGGNLREDLGSELDRLLGQ